MLTATQLSDDMTLTLADLKIQISDMPPYLDQLFLSIESLTVKK